MDGGELLMACATLWGALGVGNHPGTIVVHSEQLNVLVPIKHGLTYVT